MEGTVFDFQRYCLHDGPGIRTVVFLKGCPLRCRWCHNPESRSFEPEMMFNEKKCIGCGKCEGVDAGKCITGARKMVGTKYTAEALVDIAMADEAFWGDEGGITFSGGEPLCQSAFLAQVLALLQARGVHVAIETAGAVPWQAFEEVLPYHPLFLYDLKAADSEKHRANTGLGNEMILENLRKLSAAGAHFWVRMPIIGGVNDSPEDVQAALAIVKALPKPPQFTELLPYHKLGQHKHEMLGGESVMDDAAEVSREHMAQLNQLLNDM